MTLLESSGHLGGRARSFRDEACGELIDNCQHVILGCCEGAMEFLTKIGSAGLVEFAEKVEFVGTDGTRMRVSASSLPAPLHLAPSMIGTSYLSLSEKTALARVVGGLVLREPEEDERARDYLESLGCPPGLMERLLDPILVAALNETAREASARSARMVLTKSLVETRDGYRMGVPIVPLSELIDRPTHRYLTDRRCEVRLGTRVEGLDVRNGAVESVRLAGGETIKRDLYVCAVPPWRLDRMGVTTPASGALAWRPIVAAHLFFRSKVPDFDRACVVGEPFGWVFNKSVDFGLGRGYMQAVASAAGPIVRLSKSDLTYLALRAVSRAAAGACDGELLAATIVRETRATFSTAHEDRRRPGAVTTWPNLFLAGDWTSTGWPATIEGAVRSGYVASRAVMRWVLGESDGAAQFATRAEG